MIIVKESTTLDSALPLMGYSLIERHDDRYGDCTSWSSHNVKVWRFKQRGSDDDGGDVFAVVVEVYENGLPRRQVKMSTRSWPLAAILHVIDACWAARNEF